MQQQSPRYKKLKTLKNGPKSPIPPRESNVRKATANAEQDTAQKMRIVSMTIVTVPEKSRHFVMMIPIFSQMISVHLHAI